MLVGFLVLEILWVVLVSVLEISVEVGGVVVELRRWWFEFVIGRGLQLVVCCRVARVQLVWCACNWDWVMIWCEHCVDD